MYAVAVIWIPPEKEYYNSLIIVVIIVGIVLLYFIITAVRYQRRSLRLHKERIKAEIDTLENERKRIASDLHDELGPLLSAVKLQINNLDTTEPFGFAGLSVNPVSISIVLLQNSGKFQMTLCPIHSCAKA